MIAIIPARGGSKGLPQKNIRILDGIPLICHTINAAKRTPYIERVIVTTDDLEIARIAKEHGADVPFIRPSEFADDGASTFDVLQHCISWLYEFEGLVVSNFVLLQPTSPLRTEHHIKEAIDLFFEKNAKAVISCTKNAHPIFWSKFISDSGIFEDVFSLDQNQRQSFKDTFYPNGAIYVIQKDLLAQKNLYTPKTYAYLMSRKESVDIDTIEDFNYAAYLIANKNA